jgi:hypothetical protein
MQIEWDFKQTIFKIWRFKKKILLFPFARQCLSKNVAEIHLNRVINYLTRKLRRKWAKKVNVECDTDANFKDDQGFFKGFPAFMFRFELRAKFLNQNMYFFIKTNVIYVDLQFKRWSYRVKKQFIWSFELSKSASIQNEEKFLVAGSSVHGFLRFLVRVI